jgi:hypothetical protein
MQTHNSWIVVDKDLFHSAGVAASSEVVALAKGESINQCRRVPESILLAA